MCQSFSHISFWLCDALGSDDLCTFYTLAASAGVMSVLESYSDVLAGITAKYDCKDPGNLDRLLNIEVTRTADDGPFLSKSLYIQDVLNLFKPHLPSKVARFNGAETPTDHMIN